MNNCPNFLTSTEVIAIFAVFIAVIIPTIQGIIGRRREWHEACQFLCNDFYTLFDDINSLISNPTRVNHIAFQYYLKRRLVILNLHGKRFLLQKNRIEKVKKIIINQLMELPKNIEYEKLLILGNKDRPYHYASFCEDVRENILAATEVLVK